MRYKTTIKLITDAKDKNEAMEIAGEYLSGNLTSGVEMKLRTSPASINKEHVGLVIAAFVLVALFLIPAFRTKPAQNFISALPGDSVIQPPLKTSSSDKKFSDFKKEWETRHAHEALNSLNR